MSIQHMCLFLDINVFWNKITLHVFEYFHESINIVKGGKMCSYEKIVHTFIFFFPYIKKYRKKFYKA